MFFKLGSKKKEEEKELDMSDPVQITRVLNDNWETFSTERGVCRVVEAMTKHRYAASVQESGCNALMKLALSEHEECRRAIVTRGGIEAVLQAMEGHRDKSGIQQAGACALGNLAQRNAGASREIGKRGGVEAVLRVLRAALDTGSPRLVEKSLLALANLVSNSNDNRASVAASARCELSGITLAVKAMSEHAKDAGVQSWGCAFLANVAGCEIVPQVLDLHARVCSAGGIEAVLTAMRGHKKDASVQQRGCLMLANVTSRGVECCVDRVLRGGGIDVLIAAMCGHLGAEKVQARATVALANVAFANESTQAAMERAGGVEAVIAGMKAHKKSSPVQRDGACFLATEFMLSRCTATTVTASAHSERVPVQQAALTAVLAAMAAHPDNIDVQKWSCVASASAMTSACSSAAAMSTEGFLKASGPELVSAALARFPRAPELDRWGADALTAATRAEPALTASRVLEARGVEALATVLAAQKPGDPDVALAALVCLNIICDASGECCHRLLMLNGKDVIHGVTTQNYTSVDVFCYAEKLLASLEAESKR